MTKIPTDLQILDVVYNRYYDNFQAYSNENRIRNSKIYVPIDVKEIAKRLNVDTDIVFGRLYYHLNEKFGYKNDDGSTVEFFALRAGDDRHCINFPYLASVLSDLKDQNKKYQTSTLISILSLVIAILSIILSIIISIFGKC